MKRLFVAVVLILATSCPVLRAQDVVEEPSSALTPADAKKAAATEKRKAQLVKMIEKQVAAAQKKLKPSEEQSAQVTSILNQYYVKRLVLVSTYRKSVDPEEKKVAKRQIRQWGGKLEKTLGPILNEKQLKALKTINENDMASLDPRPSGGGGGGDGGGGGGGGGD